MSRFESVPREVPAAIKPALTSRKKEVTSASPAKIEATLPEKPEVEALEEELEGLEAEIAGTESDLAEAQAALAQQRDLQSDHSFILTLFKEGTDATAQMADLRNTIKECEEELAAAKQERAALIIKIEQAKG